ncbi:DNA polymerase [Prosthecobacter fusiformis]|uniref:Type-4 uracil-DNA glycosylase n=1 Tax=Prosthecobacter fusiformis TaxID=48464 RepID=A0A4R7S5Z2_9BACT|nr:uracil-DNA glycosylase [Prosthecobacter fusiformis]TDU72968.1 DNA polymerase [Prosthecobacter fusiformis]
MSQQAEAAGLLKHYLEQRQVAGQTHVGLRPGMVDRLLHRRGLGPQTKAAAEMPRPVRAAPPAGESVAAPASLLRETLAAPASVKPAPAAVTSAPTKVRLEPTVIEVPGATKAEKLAALAQMAEHSPEARALGTLRETMVFAVGSPEAEIMFIGEAPGSEEERQQEPFVGPAGQKLTGIIKAMGLDRSEVYISNICKFRPAMENQGYSNRPPTTVEMKTCLPYIFTEIAIIQPKILVALGKTAAEGLGLSGPVSKLRGQFYQVQGLPAMVTFHPSYILREEKLAGGGMVAKRQVWEDMLQVMEKAGLPISEKQRSYFKK